MTNPELSNSVENKAVILWQYDKARNLVTLLEGLNEIASATVTVFWDYFRDRVFNIDSADEKGLSILGRLLGLTRPTYEVGNETLPISDDLYRRLLRGRFFLLGMVPTVPNYNRYLAIIWNGWEGKFGEVDGEIVPVVTVSPGVDEPFVPKARVTDGLDMSMEFPAPVGATAEETAMHEQHPELIYIYPAGIRTNAKASASDHVIGMEGQSGLENFADAFSWVENPTASGGLFAGNAEARDGADEEAAE